MNAFFYTALVVFHCFVLAFSPSPSSLMMHSSNNGKIMLVCIIMHTMEIIHLLNNANPIQIIIDAIINWY